MLKLPNMFGCIKCRLALCGYIRFQTCDDGIIRRSGLYHIPLLSLSLYSYKLAVRLDG